MTDSSPSPFSTPKRKRTDLINEDGSSPLSTPFSFDVNVSSSVPTGPSGSGSSSPRTKVAHRFRGLALGDHGSGGGGFTAADTDTDTAAAADKMQVDEDESKMRKRTRKSPMPDTPDTPDTSAGSPKAALQAEIPETPHAQNSQRLATADPAIREPQVGLIHDEQPPKPNPNANTAGQFVLDQSLFTSSPKPSPARLSRLLPAAGNRPLEALKTKGRKRAGTPPLLGTSTKAGNADQSGDPEAEIVDPVRAALTWHEDEITIYDPEDEDDDGVGINGIGFKPTPAIAYARTMKRKQQLAEYKKREEREARARRSLKRRGSRELPGHKLERKDSGNRKVRFTETEPTMMIETI